MKQHRITQNVEYSADLITFRMTLTPVSSDPDCEWQTAFIVAYETRYFKLQRTRIVRFYV